jgi:hypothetical protein
MTLQDYSLTAFAVLNGARLVAYVPQILCVFRDQSGASSVSLMTWGLFCSANLATVIYALTVTGDRLIAGVFTLNTVGCVVVFALILKKRISHRGSNSSSSHLKWRSISPGGLEAKREKTV